MLCCGGAITAGVFLFRSVAGAAGPARAEVNDFLTDLETGRTDAAYAQLCVETQHRFSSAQFDQIAAGRPKPTAHSITNVSVMNYNGAVSATVSARLRYADASTDTHTFSLAKQGGAWRICGDPY